MKRILLLAFLSSLLSAQVLRAAPSGTAYVANTGSNSVSIVSLTTQSVIDTITVGDAPRYVAFTPNGSRAYVTNSGSDSVSVIDTASQMVIDTINVGDNPEQIVVTNDGLRAYVANYNSASISVIDIPTNAVNTINTTANPFSLALHPTRDELWIGFNPSSGNSVLEARSLTDHSVIDFETSSFRYYASNGLAFWPDGSTAIGSEACGECGRFHKISGNLPITVPQPDILFDNQGAARGIAINPVTDVAYLAKLGQVGPHRVVEFGGAGRTLLTGDPYELTVSPTGDFVYLTQLTQGGANPGSVAVIDAATFSIANSIPVGLHPHGIANQPSGLYLHYKFEGNANDSVAGRNGTLIGDAAFSSNASPAEGSTQSLALDGSLDKVIYDTTADDTLNGSFTVALWANAQERRPSSGSLTFFGTRGPASTQGTDLKYLNDSAVRADIGTGSSFLAIEDSPFTWELNEWHHLAAVVTPTQYQLYVDGVLYDSRAYSGVPLLLDAGHDLAVGAVAAMLDPHGEDFHGLIDDFRIYSRALSAHEIDELVPDPIPGDYNRDGTVNAADYAVWRNTLGATGPGLDADDNGDNAVNTADYDLWRAHFGQTAGSASVSNAVPEPATLGLCIALFAMLVAQRAAVSPGATADQPSSVKREHASISGSQAMSVISSRRLGANERENCTPQGVAATFFWTT